MGDKKNIFCSVENIIREKESRSASEERTLEEFSRKWSNSFIEKRTKQLRQRPNTC